jgi:hypothetical protein
MRSNKLVTQLRVIVFLSALHKTSAVLPGMVEGAQVGTEEIIPAVGRLIKNYCDNKNATEQDIRDLYLNIQSKLMFITPPQGNPQIQAILEIRDYLNANAIHRNQGKNINEQGVKDSLAKCLEVITPDDHGNSRTQVSSDYKGLPERTDDSTLVSSAEVNQLASGQQSASGLAHCSTSSPNYSQSSGLHTTPSNPYVRELGEGYPVQPEYHDQGPFTDSELPRDGHEKLNGDYYNDASNAPHTPIAHKGGNGNFEGDFYR